MKLFNNIKELQDFRGANRTALTIGNFDGCHLGHKSLIQWISQRAHEERLLAAILTFDPHPAEALGMVDTIPKIQSLPERLETFRNLGVEATVVIRFDQSLSAMPAQTFVDEILISGAGVRRIAIGEDFRFGHKRAGDVQLLKQMGPRHDFSVQIVAPFCVQGEAASSTRVRKCLIDEANLKLAAAILGRPWSFTGRVVRGDQIGRSIGFPTANLENIESLIPKRGVYAVTVSSKQFPELLNNAHAVMNIGVRPTVGGRQLRVEVHVLDQSNLELYDLDLEVRPVQYLRPEMKFASRELLMQQIARDCDSARTLLDSVE